MAIEAGMWAYPWDTVCHRLQMTAGEAKPKYDGVIDCVQKVLSLSYNPSYKTPCSSTHLVEYPPQNVWLLLQIKEEEGMLGFYKGCLVRVVSGLLIATAFNAVRQCKK